MVSGRCCFQLVKHARTQKDQRKNFTGIYDADTFPHELSGVEWRYPMVWRWTSYQMALAVVGVVVFGFAAKSLADDGAVVSVVDVAPAAGLVELVAQMPRQSTRNTTGYDVILIPRDGRGSPRALTQRGWTTVRPDGRQRTGQRRFDGSRPYYGGAPYAQAVPRYRRAPTWRDDSSGFGRDRGSGQDVPEWRYRSYYAHSGTGGAAYRARGY
jgi:hypothetical protein